MSDFSATAQRGVAYLLRFVFVLFKGSIIDAHGKPCAMALAQQTRFLY